MQDDKGQPAVEKKKRKPRAKKVKAEEAEEADAASEEKKPKARKSRAKVKVEVVEGGEAVVKAEATVKVEAAEGQEPPKKRRPRRKVDPNAFSKLLPGFNRNKLYRREQIQAPVVLSMARLLDTCALKLSAAESWISLQPLTKAL